MEMDTADSSNESRARPLLTSEPTACEAGSRRVTDLGCPAATTTTTLGPDQVERSFPLWTFEQALLPGPRLELERRLRLAGFLVVHAVTVCAQISLMVNFYVTGDRNMFTGLSVLMFVSGLYCSNAAWHAEAPHWCPAVLPLKQNPLRGVPLLLPLGFLQVIVVLLALEDYSARCRESGPPPTAVTTVRRRNAVNKFHCKAVVGLFEGLGSAGISIYAIWTMDFPPPPATPLTTAAWPYEKYFISACGIIFFMSSGLGLLELDFCVSKAVAKHMTRSLCYEIVHIAFRSSEIFMRMCLYIWFTIHLRSGHLWWLPFVTDLMVTSMLVWAFGGAEQGWLVRGLCSFPCMFSNIFLFIDSPYKRQAANRLSFWLTLRNIVVIVVFPLVILLSGTQGFLEVWKTHSTIVITLGGVVPIYFFLFWWLVLRHSGHFRGGIPDIYSACYNGSVELVKSAIEALTKSKTIGLNMNCYDVDGRTPLMLAAVQGHADVCRLLLQEGAQPDRRMSDDNRPCRRMFSMAKKRRWTAVHMAAARNRVEVLKVIVPREESAASADVNNLWKDSAGDTPLHVAVRKGHLSSVALLARRRPDWLECMNDKSQKPIDVTRSSSSEDEIAQALAVLDRSPEGDEEDLTSRPSQNAIRAPDRATAHVWEALELRITRSTGQEPDLIAPGLCSYVASSCGGALSLLFLTNAPRASIPRAGGGGSFDSGETDDAPSFTPGGDRAALDQPVDIDELKPATADGSVIHLGPGLANQGYPLFIPPRAILGGGSFGSVWRAKDQYGRLFAVKQIRVQRNATANSVAERECDVAATVRVKPHPCLVQLFHVHNHVSAGLYILVMELAPNGTVQDRLEERKRTQTSQGRDYEPPSLCWRWIGQVFLGLEHMHRRMDVMLRDLKAANVVLDNRDVAKLTDFGFGRFGLQSDGNWSFNFPTGTPGYIAPEILRMRSYDSRADLYSFGVLTWVILTGGPTDNEEVRPPGFQGSMNGYQNYYQDHVLMANALSRPTQNGYRALTEGPKDFIRRLTFENPDERLSLQGIREHSLMQPLQLPPFEASLDDVLAYVRRR